MGRQFDLVFREDGYQDGIVSAVTPADPPKLSITGSFLLSADASSLIGSLAISGGTGPYTVEVVSGQAPVGISFVATGASISAAGRALLDGSYSWTIKVTDSASGRYQTRQITMTMVSPDLEWSTNTNIITPNASDFGDLIQTSPWAAYSGNPTPTIDSSVSAMGRSLKFAANQCLGSPNLGIAVGLSAEMTVEFWFYNTANLGVTSGLVSFYNATERFAFYWYSGNNIAAYNQTNSRYLEGTTTLALNTRYHYAWVRDATSDRIYLNGKLEASWTTTKIACPASQIVLGASGLSTRMEFLTGFIQGLRISKVARYRNNFNPPQTYKAA